MMVNYVSTILTIKNVTFLVLSKKNSWVTRGAGGRQQTFTLKL